VGGVATFANLGIDRSGSGYTLVASAPGLIGAATAPFTVTLTPASITIVSGNGQQGFVGCFLRAPLIVQVNDRNSQPVAGVPVLWVWSTGMRATTMTGANGQASTLWQLRTLGRQTVTASVANVGSVTFVALAGLATSCWVG
jgi:hypothetical protein